mmetsp:Transcript_132224/g.382258  ORF Transcript_132224/g.382258 Transcript_132224/m.382258 type:complete len:388 (+) Transcript_132224:929-2092(+)
MLRLAARLLPPDFAATGDEAARRQWRPSQRCPIGRQGLIGRNAVLVARDALPLLVGPLLAREPRRASGGPVPAAEAVFPGDGLRPRSRAPSALLGRQGGGRATELGDRNLRHLPPPRIAPPHLPRDRREARVERPAAAVDGVVEGLADVRIAARARTAGAPHAGLAMNLQAGEGLDPGAVAALQASRLIGERAAAIGDALQTIELLRLLHLGHPRRRRLATSDHMRHLRLEDVEGLALAAHHVVEGPAEGRGVAGAGHAAAPHAWLAGDPEAMLVVGLRAAVRAIQASSDVGGGRAALRERVEAPLLVLIRRRWWLPRRPQAAPNLLHRGDRLPESALCHLVHVLRMEVPELGAPAPHQDIPGTAERVVAIFADASAAPHAWLAMNI